MSFYTLNSEITGITIALPKKKIINPTKKKNDRDFISHTGVKSYFSNDQLKPSDDPQSCITKCILFPRSNFFKNPSKY